MHNDTVSLYVWFAWASLVLSLSEPAASQRVSERPVGDALALPGARPDAAESRSYRAAAEDQWPGPYFGAALVVAVLLLVACVVLTWCWDWKGARQEEGVAKDASSLPPPLRSSANFQAALSQSDCAAAVASPRYPALQAAGGASGGASYGATPLSSSRVSLTPRWLCPQLTVPVGTELHCVLPSLMSGAKQNLIVPVCSIAERGSKPLFQARVVEADGDQEGPHRAAISLETPGGEGRLAFVSTREVWARTAGREPAMEMMRASGAKFGTIKKNETGGYTITGEKETVAVYCGHAMKHDMRVTDSCGATLAEVIPGRSSDTYDVVVYPNVDAGLVVLGILAIEKKERVESSLGSA